MSRHQRRANDTGLTAIIIEGGLISPAQLALIAATPPDLKTAADYNCPKGTNLRDEITRYFRIAQAHWQAYARIENANAVQVAHFAKALLEGAFGFEQLTGPHRHTLDEHTYRITWEGKGGRVPVVAAAPLAGVDAFNKSLPELGDESDGTIARRSPVVLLQDWLNANDQALWGLCFVGDRLRLMRDNASLTRQSYIEADLGAIFKDEIFSDFTALWLLIHATRFGGEGQPAADCALERWREAGQQAGTTARQRLGANVQDALQALGQGILDANPDIKARLDDNSLEIKVLFEQILRIVYRLIFLAVAEDRDLLHPRNTAAAARALYKDAYSFDCLRERAGRRSSHDHHADAWEGMLVGFKALEYGEKLLGLPALGGLFSSDLTPDLNTARLPNRAFLTAIFRLSFLIDKGQRVRINWRDMATEELGSVYEGLLELVPIREDQGRKFGFAGGDEQKGNARKTSGSYYTPDSLVQALLDTALDPVLDRAEAEGGAEAILKLTVIDPACGSGHFLLGAARRMATRVAQARNPDAPDYNAAMRDVVRNTIYGVDRNPMAVELTKVALWIETVEPGKPLGFLDANIRCGDSLLGVFDLSVLDQGIPDAAYKPLSGDDKDACKILMKVNRGQRGRKDLDITGINAPADLATAQRRVHDMAEDSPSQLKAKAEAFAALRQGGNWWGRKTACDLYIAAFLRPKRLMAGTLAGTQVPDKVPTSHDVRTALSGGQGNAQLTGLAVEVAGDAYAFHWPLEFPDIFAAGGFDVVIGNPPWERIKLQEKEFFAALDPDIATAPSAAERTRLINALRDAGPGTPQRLLYDRFEIARRSAEAASEFGRVPGEDGGRFPLTGRGDVNTYALFAEHFARLTKPRGRAGVIVPTGIATDATTAPFFASLVDHQKLASLFDFENRDALFEGVHRSYKFCLLTLGHGIALAQFAFFLTDTAQLQDAERRFTLSPQQIAKINPNTKTAPVFRSRRDAELTAKIYDRTPVLVNRSEEKISSPWHVRLTTMLHKTNASNSGDLMPAVDVSAAQIAAGQWIYVHEGDIGHQFDHRFATFENGVVRAVTATEHNNPNFEPSFEFVASRKSFQAYLERWDLNPNIRSFVGFRRVARSTDERTSISAILPVMPSTYGWILLIQPGTLDQATLCANMNCLVLDFCIRSSLSQPSIPQNVYEQLPFIQPISYADSCRQFIAPRVLELTYTSHSMAPFARDMGYEGPPFAWDEDRRAMLRAELDAFFARKYGLSRDELRYILDPADVMGEHYPSETFRVLKNKEIKAFGEYRTQRLVLEAWDRLEQRSVSTILAGIVFDPDAEPDGAWTWPTGSGAADTTLPQLAAIIKALPNATLSSIVRLAAIFALQPRYLTRQLKGADRALWLRLVGSDAQDNGAANVIPFRQRIDVAWRKAVAQLIGTGALIENAADGTWAYGAGLEGMPLSAWSDGRARFALQMIERYGLDKIDLDLATEDKAWVATNAA
jgi:hypothetical protein